MALFKRSEKKAAKGRSTTQAKPIAIISNAENTRGLAFGMNWSAIVESNGRASAINRSRDNGATHFLFRNEQVGYGFVAKGTQLPTACFPASVIAGRMTVGTGVFCISMGEGEYWLAVTRKGAPSNQDDYLTGANDVEVLERLRVLLDKLNKDSEKPTTFTNLRDSGIENAKPIRVEDLLESSLSKKDQIVPLPLGDARRTKALTLATVGVALLVGANYAWDTYKAQRALEEAAKANQMDLPPEEAWKQSIAEWSVSVAGPNSGGMNNVRASMADVPAKWDGWTLKQVQCKAGVVAEKGRTWTCIANYERGQDGALNSEIVKMIPKGWTVNYKPLNKMEASWTVTDGARAVVAEQLKSQSYHRIETASKLQRIARAFVRDIEYDFTKVEIPAPKKHDGVDYEPIPNLPSISQAKLILQGPLRSIDAAIAAGVDVSWSQLNIAFVPDVQKVGLQTSAIVAEATGTLYAKD